MGQEPADGRRPLFISAEQCEVGGIEGGNVGMRLRTPEVDNLLPSLDLVIRLAPGEARALAEMLVRWSHLAENEAPKH